MTPRVRQRIPVLAVAALVVAAACATDPTADPPPAGTGTTAAATAPPGTAGDTASPGSAAAPRGEGALDDGAAGQARPAPLVTVVPGSGEITAAAGSPAGPTTTASPAGQPPAQEAEHSGTDAPAPTGAVPASTAVPPTAASDTTATSTVAPPGGATTDHARAEDAARPPAEVPSGEAGQPPSSAAPAPAPGEPPAPVEPAPPRRVLVISDSSGAGMRWAIDARPALAGAEFTLDLESCRRLITRSCNGREGYVPGNALRALTNKGEGHDTLVVLTGYNDSDREFETAFEYIYQTAVDLGIGTVIWATYREDVGYSVPDGARASYAAMNEVLWAKAAGGAHPALHVLDWWGYTFEAPEWFARDGVHYRAAGALGMADLISRTLAHLDGRPCPAPWAPGEAVDDPCPLPYPLPQERGGVPPVLELYG